jgi:hypothetical protein
LTRKSSGVRQSKIIKMEINGYIHYKFSVIV